MATASEMLNSTDAAPEIDGVATSVTLLPFSAMVDVLISVLCAVKYLGASQGRVGLYIRVGKSGNRVTGASPPEMPCGAKTRQI